MQYKDSLYWGNKENAQHKGRKKPKNKVSNSGEKADFAGVAERIEHELTPRAPSSSSNAAKHGLKWWSVAFTRNQRAKTPWRMRTTRRAPVKHATNTSGGRGGKRRGMWHVSSRNRRMCVDLASNPLKKTFKIQLKTHRRRHRKPATPPLDFLSWISLPETRRKKTRKTTTKRP